MPLATIKIRVISCSQFRQCCAEETGEVRQRVAETGKMIRQKSSWQQGLGIPPELGEKEKGEQERVGEEKMGEGNGRDKRGEKREERGREKKTEQQRIREVHHMTKLTFELNSGLVSRLLVPCPGSSAVNCIPLGSGMTSWEIWAHNLNQLTGTHRESTDVYLEAVHLLRSASLNFSLKPREAFPVLICIREVMAILTWV